MEKQHESKDDRWIRRLFIAWFILVGIITASAIGGLGWLIYVLLSYFEVI